MRQNIRNQQQQILLPTTTGSKQSDEGVVTSGIPVSTKPKKSIFLLLFLLPYRMYIYKMISPNQTADGKPPTGNLDQGKITDGAYMGPRWVIIIHGFDFNQNIVEESSC